MKQFPLSSLLLLVGISWLPFASRAMGQLIYEDHFNYPAGALPGNGGWTEFGIANVDKVGVASGSLNGPAGFAPSAGNMATYGGTGSDAYVNFGGSSNSGTVYYSFLLRLTDLNSLGTGGIYLGGLVQENAAAYASGFISRLDADNSSAYNLGLLPRQTNVATNAAWTDVELSINTTYLIVVSHTFVSGASNDVSKLWISPASASFGGSEPAAILTTTNPASDISSLGGFFLNQQSSAVPEVLFDELRVGTSWASVTPVPEPAAAVLILAGAGLVVIRRRA